MKIVLAASIYPPEVGGPSFYAASLKDALEKLGHEVDVAVLSSYKQWPSGIRHFIYACALFSSARKADAIIAFDVHATGLPAAIVGKLCGIPIVIRVGGDFVWEHYVNRTGDRVPLPQFYAHQERWNMKERFVFALKRFVTRRVRLVFSSQWLAGIWKEPYGIDVEYLRVIENAIPPKLEAIMPTRKNFIFYARQIPLKNTDAFRRAFAHAKEKYPDIELDEGMVPHTEFIEHMRSCYAAVLPSVSDVTPNSVIDALRCGKPFLLTKYSGYAERFGQYGVLVDPLDESDMARGVEALCDSGTYEMLRAKIAQFREVRTYDDIAQEFIALLNGKI
jgi:glycosyltransferase involved in cell wall biosynthesis